jgi:hypothetical protein
MIRSLSILAALGLLALAACAGSDRASGPQENFVGLYTLSRVQGQALPWTIPGFSCENSVRSGEMRVMSDFTLKGSLAYRYDCKSGGVSAPVTATWSFSGDWTGAGGELMLIHDSLPAKDFGPVFTDGTLVDGGLNLTADVRDCKGTGQGVNCKTTAQAVFNFAK